MIKLIIILFYLIILVSSTLKNNQEIVPKELFHGIVKNDSWEIEKFYEYYLNISDYELYEENIFEIYGKNININSSDIKLYLLLTDIKDVELIKQGIIKPNIEEDIYPISSENIKFDTLSNRTYLFIPFFKNSSLHNFLIILVENINNDQFDVIFYISKRIQIINIEPDNSNNIEVFTKEIEAKDDIRLYYKINIENIDLIQNNLYLFVNKFENETIVLEVVYYLDFFSLYLIDFNIFTIEKNSLNISETYLGIKSKNNYNKERYVNISIRIDDNKFYYLSGYQREKSKIYVENMECNKDVFIFEDYLENNNTNSFYSILDELYGNFSLYYYYPIKDLNFENFDESDAIEISKKILKLYSLVNVYILKCFTPTAFHFEIFFNSDMPIYMPIGETIKTYLPSSRDYQSFVHLKNLNEFYEFKVKVRILDDDIMRNRTLTCLFHNQRKDEEIDIIEPNYEHKQLFYEDYFDYYYPHFSFKNSYDMIVEYYYTSNYLFKNIVEGRTKIDSLPFIASFKISKTELFDYILIEVESEENIIGEYELKLINKEDIEDETNIVYVGLPRIWLPYSNSINLKFSNPYNKYDQIANIKSENNYFYILFVFYTESKPIYLNIEYIYNEEIVNISPIKAEIILLKTEYEINLDDNNYRIKDKLLFNINKCNNLVNYTLFNYYENKQNILKETQITNSYQTIILDNRYKKSKMILNKELEEEIKNDSIIYPAAYYNKGDILLNYFLIESSILKEIKFTSDFNINYEEETWSNIILYWKEYVYIESNDEKINIATNYSIYILPKNSVVNTICQLYLIPSNKSIINSTKTKIYLNEGEYKIFIIADVIDENMPFKNIYNIMTLKIVKVINVTLIVILSVL